jgi:glycosyltransferase involved in cell wall biosynthesis
MIIESSACIANRTAVYEITREIGKVAGGSRYRYWFFVAKHFIEFGDAKVSLAGRALWRVMMRTSALSVLWRRSNHNEPFLFVDPLFARYIPVRDGDCVLVHDMGPITHPEFYDEATSAAYEAAYLTLLRHDVSFVFVSEYTRQSFMKYFYPVQGIKAAVIPNFFRDGAAGNVERDTRSTRLFLSPGALDRRKNHGRTIEAFAESGLAAEGYHLAITGPRGNCAPEIIEKARRVPNVRYLGYVSSAELVRLYGQARALVFASLYEGFGVPAIEAPALGVLPLISNIPSLIEITGPDAVIVQPYSVADIAAGMRSIAAMTVVDYDRRVLAIRRYQEHFSLENFHDRWREQLR